MRLSSVYNQNRELRSEPRWQKKRKSMDIPEPSSTASRPADEPFHPLVDSPDNNVCTICWQHYRDPRLLQCLHSFCAACLDQLAVSADREGCISCPICRANNKLPQSGASGLPRDISLSFHLHSSPQCAECSKESTDSPGADPQFTCGTCTIFLCSHHVVQHLQSPSPSGRHSIEAFNASSPAPEKSTEDNSLPSSQVCTQHRQPLRFFCLRCDVVICGDCALVGEHSSLSHKPIKSLSDEIKRRKTRVLQQIDTLRNDVSEHLESSLKSVEGEADNLSSSAKRVRKELDAAGEKAVEAVRLCVQQKLQVVEDFVSSRGKVLDERKEEIQSHLNMTRRAVDFSDRIMEHDTAEDFYPLLRALERRVTGLRQMPKPFVEVESKVRLKIAFENCAASAREEHAAKIIGQLTTSASEYTQEDGSARSSEMPSRSVTAVKTPLKKQTVTLFVEIGGGEGLSLEADLAESVPQLKRKIADHRQGLLDGWKLVAMFTGRILDDRMTLADCATSSQLFLQLVNRPPPSKKEESN